MADHCDFWERYLSTQDDVDGELLLLELLEKHIQGCYTIYRADPTLGAKCLVGVLDGYIKDLVACVLESMVREA